MAIFENTRRSARTSCSRVAAVVLLLAITTSACVEGQEKEGVGTLMGAALGAWIGSEIGGHGDSQVVGAALGTFIGAGIGASIGRELDRADRLAMENAYYQSLEYSPSGETSTWYNPDSGNSGSFTPSEAYEASSNEYCREYTQTITVGGETVEGYGTACRQPDGSWKIISG